MDRIKHSLESPTRKTAEQHKELGSDICDQNNLGASLDQPTISSSDTMDTSEVNVSSNPENDNHNMLEDTATKPHENISLNHSTKDIEVPHIRSVAPIARVSPSPMPIPVQEVQPLGASASPMGLTATSSIPGTTR